MYSKRKSVELSELTRKGNKKMFLEKENDKIAGSSFYTKSFSVVWKAIAEKCSEMYFSVNFLQGLPWWPQPCLIWSRAFNFISQL